MDEFKILGTNAINNNGEICKISPKELKENKSYLLSIDHINHINLQNEKNHKKIKRSKYKNRYPNTGLSKNDIEYIDITDELMVFCGLWIADGCYDSYQGTKNAISISKF